jgi:hypothetical protein
MKRLGIGNQAFRPVVQENGMGAMREERLILSLTESCGTMMAEELLFDRNKKKIL